MRRRSADSIMASAESPSSQKQAGYMYASLPAAPSKEALAYEAGPYMTPKFVRHAEALPGGRHVVGEVESPFLPGSRLR